MRSKEGESIEPMNELILARFNEINQAAISAINQWRLGQKEIIDKVNINGAHDVVTGVDIAIEDITNETFSGIAPVFGEENFKSDFSLVEKPLYIVVDPIDGTKEFVKGSDEWSISLCAVQNGEPIIASIFMPDKHQHFTATKGKGLRLNGSILQPSDSIRKRIAVSPRQIKDPRIIEYITKSGLDPLEVSALTPKICAILRGEVNAAAYFPQQGQSAALWDYAAGVLLIQESGGKITSICGSDLPFRGSDIIHKKGWLATRNIDHNSLLACLSGVANL